MGLAARQEAHCDTAGCRTALHFAYKWLASGQVAIYVWCRRCKQEKTHILTRTDGAENE